MNRHRTILRMLFVIAGVVGLWAGLSPAASDDLPIRVLAQDVPALRTLAGRSVTVCGRVTGHGCLGQQRASTS